MVEQDWTPSTIMLSQLQKLMKHGFMVVVEFEACWVPEDPSFPSPVGGYMVSIMTFYEWGFHMPPHRFLHSPLRYYDLKLHHLTPSGVLHIAAFMTPYEAYLGIDPELDLWKFFFHVRHLQDPEAELTIFGATVIHVKAGHGVHPYLKIYLPGSMKGWWKKWVYLKNGTSAPLPLFIGGRPVPLPSCHTPFRERGNKASIRVPRMFKSHAWQQLINRCNVINKRVILLT
jgi:hypothetical protein